MGRFHKALPNVKSAYAALQNFTPDLKKIYTDISAISVTFRNSVRNEPPESCGKIAKNEKLSKKRNGNQPLGTSLLKAVQKMQKLLKASLLTAVQKIHKQLSKTEFATNR